MSTNKWLYSISNCAHTNDGNYLSTKYSISNCAHTNGWNVSFHNVFNKQLCTHRQTDGQLGDIIYNLESFSLTCRPLPSQDVDDVFRKYDPRGTGKLDVHSFVKRLVSPASDNVNWFRDKNTYEFHVLNRAPMKKASLLCFVRRVRCAPPRACVPKRQDETSRHEKQLEPPTIY